ncbi:MAG: tRNA 2-selenouridine(34) synthase MnmH [Caulobacteraceae bacterium]
MKAAPVIEIVESADPESLSRFSEIIDVRTPAEWGEDHIFGSVNLPVLSNEERARVGTIYRQDCPHEARRIGAALVARNIARHLEGPLAGKDRSFSPLLYCWRGGQRSAAMASVFSQIGWRVRVLEGGYKTYRRRVVAALYEEASPLNAVLLEGSTGAGKTEMLSRLCALGVQTLDLEALAAHRGSLFGALPGEAQPSQKLFESRLLAALEALDPQKPVVIEAESSKVGDLMIPPALWRTMAGASAIGINAPAAERAKYLLCAYGDISADIERLEEIIQRLPVHLSKDERAAWRALARAGALEELARSLLLAHYDPAYQRSMRKAERMRLGTIELTSLSEGARAEAAEKIATMVRDFGS